jgi:hypothetical protein
MIDEEKAIAAVGEAGVALYRRILGDIQKFEGVGSSGRIGGRLSIICKIKGKGPVYIDIYKDRVNMQLGNKSYEDISRERCLVEFEIFLKD